MTAPSPISGARPARPVSGIQDDLAPMGDRKVGHARDTVNADRQAQPKRRNQLVMVLVAVVLTFAGASWWGKRPKAVVASPLVQAGKATAGTPGDVDPALRDAAKNRPPADSFPNIDLGDNSGQNPSLGATAGAITGTAPTANGGALGSDGRDGRSGRGGSDTSQNHTFSLTPLLPSSHGAGAGGASGSGAGGAPSSGFLPVSSTLPLLPPDAANHPSPPSGPPSIAERMKAAKGFGAANGASGGASAASTLYPTKRSALAPEAPIGGAGAPGGAGGAEAPAWRFTPGVEVSASFLNDSPSAASGEPLVAVLDVALVDRGTVILPAGTKALGTGGSWDDGTNNPRLAVKFTTFILPDQSVRTFPATAYSPDDHRPGLVVPYNHQVARKGATILSSAATAAAFAKLMPPEPQTTSGLTVTVDPTFQARQQAANDVYSSLSRELNLAKPAVSILYELAAGTKTLLVFGMP